MPYIGSVHIAFAVSSLAFGTAVVLTPKGTRRHRMLGRAYALSMLGLNVTALLIYRLFGRFGPFHIAAIVSLVTTAIGVSAVVFRRPRKHWYRIHADFMSWSYIGLLAAAAAETATRYLTGSFAFLVLGSTVLIVGAGAYVVYARVPVAMRRARFSAAKTQRGEAAVAVNTPTINHPIEVSHANGKHSPD